MGFTNVKATIATTGPVPKYTGWRLSRGVLQDMAERLAQNTVPMLFDHDAREPIECRVISTQVVQRTDGEWALEAELSFDDESWCAIQDRFDAAGAPGGFSFTASVTQQHPKTGAPAEVCLAADAAAWTDRDRAEAGALLDEIVPTRVDRLFQYSAVELATILLLLGNVALGVLGNATYDVIKRLMRGRTGLTRVEIEFSKADGSAAKAVILTDDPEVVREALDALSSKEPSATMHYDVNRRLWLDY
jgi:hypothetical protein